MPLIQLNNVLLDYLTLTSYSGKWFNYMMESLGDENDEAYEIKSRGYEGWAVVLVSGSISFLSGFNEGKQHYIVRISGSLANYAIQNCLDISKGFDVNCSRMDVQVTVMKPARMSMIAMRNRLETKYKVGYPQPEIVDGRKIETVYIGTREKSDRFYRFYVKPTSDGDCVRFEVELKKRRSRAIFAEWQKNGLSRDSIAYEVEKMAKLDKMATKLILPLSEQTKRVMVRTLESKTERWLIKDVFPVLKRVLCSHSSDSVSVYAALMDVLEAYEDSKDDK